MTPVISFVFFPKFQKKKPYDSASFEEQTIMLAADDPVGMLVNCDPRGAMFPPIQIGSPVVDFGACRTGLCRRHTPQYRAHQQINFYRLSH
jgi:hypothetical protein